MELKTKLYLVDEDGEKFMGIGVLWLLQKVAEEKSLRKGAAKLGISYSKAFLMVRALEKELGVPVLDRKKGGAEHSGATLTSFGEEFIRLYDTFQTEAKKVVEEPYKRFSDGLAELLERTETKEDANGAD
jgi:molybdate transport system regulatory protein